MHSLSIFPEISISITTRSDGPVTQLEELLKIDTPSSSGKQVLLPVHEHATNILFVQDGDAVIPSGDIVVCHSKKLAIAHLFADCVPLIILDRVEKAFVFSHLGWKGLVQGGVQISLFALLSQQAHRNRDLWAWVGPSIKKHSYRQSTRPLQTGLPTWARAIEEQSSGTEPVWMVDLPGFVLDELVRCGLAQDHIIVDERDTYHESEIFFSHQRFIETNDPREKGNFAVVCSLIES